MTLDSQTAARRSDEPQLRVHIRWMIRRDMPEVLAIEHASYEFPWCEEEFLRVLRQRNCIGMVAECGERVVGFMIYELHKTRLQVLNLAVAPDYRRMGVGRQMVAKLVGKLSSHRRTRIGLQVRETTAKSGLALVRRSTIDIATAGSNDGGPGFASVYATTSGSADAQSTVVVRESILVDAPAALAGAVGTPSVTCTRTITPLAATENLVCDAAGGNAFFSPAALFLDAAARDYRLADASPAIDVGRGAEMMRARDADDGSRRTGERHLATAGNRFGKIEAGIGLHVCLARCHMTAGNGSCGGPERQRNGGGQHSHRGTTLHLGSSSSVKSMSMRALRSPGRKIRIRPSPSASIRSPLARGQSSKSPSAALPTVMMP